MTSNLKADLELCFLCATLKSQRKCDFLLCVISNCFELECEEHKVSRMFAGQLQFLAKHRRNCAHGRPKRTDTAHHNGSGATTRSTTPTDSTTHSESDAGRIE